MCDKTKKSYFFVQVLRYSVEDINNGENFNNRMKKNAKRVFESIKPYFEDLGYKYIKKEQCFTKIVAEAMYCVYFLDYSADSKVSIYAEIDIPFLLPYFTQFWANNCNLCRFDYSYYDKDSDFCWDDLMSTPEEFEQEIKQAIEDIKTYYTEIMLPDFERVNTVDKFLKVFEENDYQHIRPNNGFLNYSEGLLVTFLILIKIYQPENYQKHKDNLYKMLRPHEVNYFEREIQKLEGISFSLPK